LEILKRDGDKEENLQTAALNFRKLNKGKKNHTFPDLKIKYNTFPNCIGNLLIYYFS